MISWWMDNAFVLSLRNIDSISIIECSMVIRMASGLSKLLFSKSRASIALENVVWLEWTAEHTERRAHNMVVIYQHTHRQTERPRERVREITKAYRMHIQNKQIYKHMHRMSKWRDAENESAAASATAIFAFCRAFYELVRKRYISFSPSVSVTLPMGSQLGACVDRSHCNPFRFVWIVALLFKLRALFLFRFVCVSLFLLGVCVCVCVRYTHILFSLALFLCWYLALSLLPLLLVVLLASVATSSSSS